MATSIIIPQQRVETPTLQNSFTGAFSEPLFFTRVGNIVHMNGFITRPSNPPGGTVIANVSAPFRPLNLIRCFLMASGTTVNGRVDLNTSGDLVYVWGDVVTYGMLSTAYVVL